MELTEITTRLAVADLLARYQRLADSGRLDDLIDLFVPGGTFETNNDSHQGVEAIRGFFDATVEALTGLDTLPGRHHLSSIQIDPGPESASTYACFVWFGQKGADHWGTYRDEVVLVDGSWRFKRRRLKVEGWVPTSHAIDLVGETRAG